MSSIEYETPQDFFDVIDRERLETFEIKNKIQLKTTLAFWEKRQIECNASHYPGDCELCGAQ